MRQTGDRVEACDVDLAGRQRGLGARDDIGDAVESGQIDLGTGALVGADSKSIEKVAEVAADGPRGAADSRDTNRTVLRRMADPPEKTGLTAVTAIDTAIGFNEKNCQKYFPTLAAHQIHNGTLVAGAVRLAEIRGSGLGCGGKVGMVGEPVLADMV